MKRFIFTTFISFVLFALPITLHASNEVVKVSALNGAISLSRQFQFSMTLAQAVEIIPVVNAAPVTPVSTTLKAKITASLSFRLTLDELYEFRDILDVAEQTAIVIAVNTAVGNSITDAKTVITALGTTASDMSTEINRLDALIVTKDGG
jgi:hypothetical protein